MSIYTKLENNLWWSKIAMASGAWLNSIAILIIIVIIIVVILVFGLAATLRDLPQIQLDPRLERYSKHGWKHFRTYNPSIFSLDETNCYYVYRLCNFALCPGTRNQWNARYRDRTISHTVIENPHGGLAIIKHPRLDQIFVDQDEKRGGGRNFEQGGEDALPFVIGNKLMLEDGLTEISPKRILKLQYEDGCHRDQKNWMPFTVRCNGSKTHIGENEKLHFVYSVNPHVILKFEKDGHCSQIIRVTKWNPGYHSHLKSEPRYFPEELYLGVLHKRDSTFEYMTYIYAFETKHPYRVKYITDSFVFGEYGSRSRRIQFAAGLARVVKNHCTYLYITYGENDCSSKLCILKEEDVIRSLRRL